MGYILLVAFLLILIFFLLGSGWVWMNITYNAHVTRGKVAVRSIPRWLGNGYDGWSDGRQDGSLS